MARLRVLLCCVVAVSASLNQTMHTLRRLLRDNEPSNVMAYLGIGVAVVSSIAFISCVMYFYCREGLKDIDESADSEAQQHKLAQDKGPSDDNGSSRSSQDTVLTPLPSRNQMQELFLLRSSQSHSLVRESGPQYRSTCDEPLYEDIEYDVMEDDSANNYSVSSVECVYSVVDPAIN